MFFIPAQAADSRAYDDAHIYILKLRRREKDLGICMMEFI